MLRGRPLRPRRWKRLGRFLQEQICRPLELEFAKGLDDSQQGRAVELTGLDDPFRRKRFWTDRSLPAGH